MHHQFTRAMYMKFGIRVLGQVFLVIQVDDARASIFRQGEERDTCAFAVYGRRTVCCEA